MRKEICICDHCGEEFDSKIRFGEEFDSKGGFSEIDLGDLPFVEEADLCSKCYDEISDIVGKFMPRIKRKWV